MRHHRGEVIQLGGDGAAGEQGRTLETTFQLNLTAFFGLIFWGKITLKKIIKTITIKVF